MTYENVTAVAEEAGKPLQESAVTAGVENAVLHPGRSAG